MVLHRQLAISFFYIVFAAVAVDAQHFIVIAFTHGVFLKKYTWPLSSPTTLLLFLLRMPKAQGTKTSHPALRVGQFSSTPCSSLPRTQHRPLRPRPAFRSCPANLLPRQAGLAEPAPANTSSPPACAKPRQAPAFWLRCPPCCRISTLPRPPSARLRFWFSRHRRAFHRAPSRSS